MFIGNWGRPGVTSGHYPEKQLVELGWVEKAWKGLQKGVGPHAVAPPGPGRRFVRRVVQSGAAMEQFSRDALKTEIKAARSSLHRQRFRPESVVRTFALVRELAARILKIRPSQAQILAGWGLLASRAVESEDMDKSVAIALAAATAGLTGVPVHVLTATDYLARRDAERLQPLYHALGLNVTYVVAGMELDARQTGYRSDIVYVTHKQIAFDYLRDRLVSEGRRSRLQMHLDRLNEDSERARNLLLRGLCFCVIDEADTVLFDEARTPLMISRNTDNPGSHRVYEKALELARKLMPSTDFEVDETAERLRLTSSGQIRIGQMTEELGGMWSGPARSQDLILQALTALHLLIRDRHYTVNNEKILVDHEAAQRLDLDPQWNRGLYHLLEMKEELPHSGDRETLAKISYQELFQRYLRLGAIARTLCENRNELERTYPLKTLRVPPRIRAKRRRGPIHVFPDAQKKWEALVTRVATLKQAGRPVVIGLRSPAGVELLSSMLDKKRIAHQVLISSQDEDEAARLKKAGRPGYITLMLNQAGHGMLLPLPPDAMETGGVMVIIAEVSETRRHDRKLIQRCGAGKRPGGYEFFLSREDDIVRQFAPGWAVNMVTAFGWMGPWVRRVFLRLTQRAAERHYAKSRMRLLDMDKQTNRVLAFSGRSE